MGTRFIATVEAAVHQNVKRQIVANDENSTMLIFRKFHNTARVARNSISEEIARIEARADSTFDEIADSRPAFVGAPECCTKVIWKVDCGGPAWRKD
jgi:nitronate monooxygenase